ncbi:hypothetical protein NYE48_07470 [Paenibacillus sp. FSL M7-1455]|uniref:DUF3976 domain-containing protein n=2 Tax=Paenibacillus TaxID=44249 RepID=A0ABQ4LXH9_9BACL|nr:hypothetical protein [Paenibacillus cookii]KHF36592.1 hypothetical protein CM49_01248 [Paenibacillus sp. P1XP2]GIO67980.1 hypothetical protein J21TS3_28010 [Paenibacillus cookii]HWO54353.1 hypothetical protein [Paenibacillus cookii]
MFWLLVMAVLVMAAGFVATMMIGQSKSNKESDPNYFKHTGKKWGRLSGIYVACIIVLAVIMIMVGTGK